VEVSVAEDDDIVKLVEAALALTLNAPGATPDDCAVRNIRVLAVINEFVTVTVPATSVASPILQFALPLAVASLIENPDPTVRNDIMPFLPSSLRNSVVLLYQEKIKTFTYQLVL